MNNKLIEKKVFLDNLPIIQNGRGRGHIDWTNSIGKKVRFVYGDIKGELLITGYIKGNCGKIVVQYENNPETEVFVYNFKKADIKVALLGKSKTTDFKFELKENLIDDNRNITIIDRKRTKDKRGIRRNYYKYKCNKCGFNCGKHWNTKEEKYKDELWIEENTLITHNIGCSCCASRIVVENINSIYKTDPWMIPFIGEECAKTHTHSSRDKIYPLCSDCGKFKETPIAIWVIYQNHSMGCGCKRY